MLISVLDRQHAVCYYELPHGVICWCTYYLLGTYTICLYNVWCNTYIYILFIVLYLII